MATIKTEIVNNVKMVTLSTTLDPQCDDVYDVVMYIEPNGSIGSGWFIRKNGKPISRGEMIWDDRYVLHCVLKREFSSQFVDAKLNFKTHFGILLTE